MNQTRRRHKAGYRLSYKLYRQVSFAISVLYFEDCGCREWYCQYQVETTRFLGTSLFNRPFQKPSLCKTVRGMLSMDFYACTGMMFRKSIRMIGHGKTDLLATGNDSHY